jgi:hypothetical protein
MLREVGDSHAAAICLNWVMEVLYSMHEQSSIPLICFLKSLVGVRRIMYYVIFCVLTFHVPFWMVNFRVAFF